MGPATTTMSAWNCCRSSTRPLAGRVVLDKEAHSLKCVASVYCPRMRLFKYVAGHVACTLRDNTLKITPPSDFDDPFEFCPRFDERNPTDLFAAVDQQIGSFGEQNLIRLLIDARIVRNADEAKQLLNRPDARLVFAQRLAHEAQNHVRTNQARISKEFGVACFTENENDLIMWSWYGDKHKGALIELDLTKFVPKWNVKLIQVDYGVERARFNPAAKGADHQAFVLDTVRRKSPIWASQREWRTMCLLSDCNQLETPQGKIFLIEIPDDSIVRVVLGVRFPETEISKIAAVNKARKHPAKLQKARMHDQHFEIHYNDLG